MFKTSILFSWLHMTTKEVVHGLVDEGVTTNAKINDMSRTEMNQFIQDVSIGLLAEIDRRIPVPTAS